MLVKICGITNLEDATAVVDAGADLVGFVFRRGTPRAVDAARAQWIRDVRGVETVGVFLDAPLDEMIRTRESLGLDWVQLHGNEPDGFLDSLGTRVIRRVPGAQVIDWERVAELAKRCLPLFDPGAGDGISWAWEILAERPEGLPVGLAGGLTPENVGQAVQVVRPRLVDVSSGVETAPGIKDHAKVREFVMSARRADG